MATGTIYWDGSTSTDCTAAANWTAGTSDSTVPLAADEVIFDGRAGQDFDPTTVCAVGNTGGIDFDLIHVKSGHTGTIGATNLPYHTSAQRIIIEGSGTYYFECSEDATGKDQVIPIVIINNSSATVYLTSNQNDASWCCEFTDIHVIAGTVYIGNNGTADVDTAVQYLRFDPQHNALASATVNIAIDCERYKATTYKMSIYMQNGTVTSDSAATLIDMYDGIFNFGTALATAEADLNITTLRVRGNSLFNWYPDDDGDPQIDYIWMFGGIFEASGTTNNHQSKAIGGGAGKDIYVFRGATMKLNNNMGNITTTASSQIWNFGGTVNVDNGAQLTIAYDLP